MAVLFPMKMNRGLTATANRTTVFLQNDDCVGTVF
jgi:hypothetical protein